MRILKWTAIILSVIIAACALFVGVLSLRNSSASGKWTASPDKRGSLVSVGDHRLFCTVKGSGSPTVVFEGDTGSSSPEWWAVQDSLPESCTSLTYDRAGYGWSEAGPRPRTPQQIVKELEALLKEKGLNGPYILVGQGMGGLYMQYFAAAHRNEIKGIVLVEPYGKGFARFSEELQPVVYKNLFDRMPGLKMASILGSAGIIRYFRATPYMKTPEKIRDLIMENYSKKAALEAMIDEYRRIPVRKADKVTDIGKLPPVPIVLIHHAIEPYRRELLSFYLSYNDVEQIEGLWMDMHRDIAGQSPKGRVMYARESSRDIHLNEPGLVRDTVISLLNR